MAISKMLEYLHIERLRLDPQNPRLGRDKRRANLNQDALLAQMSLWTLDELVDSFIQAGGFWTQDALIAVPYIENNHATDTLVVVEGNRRLAALKLLHGAVTGTRVRTHYK